MADTPMIEAEGLTKRYGETLALAGIDLEVPAGSILGVLGPNGAGKTTAVRILTTLALPDARLGPGGRLRRGHRGGRPCAASIGVTAQDATLDEAAHRPPEPGHGRRAQRPAPVRGQGPGRRAARPVRPHRRRRPGDEGLLGRHAPAARPGRRPGDPPPGALPRRADHRARPDQPGRACGTSSGSWWPTGVTLLLTTQYLDEADDLADRIVVIDHGRVIAEGTSAELKAATGGARLEVTLTEPRPRGRGRPAALRRRAGAREPRRSAAAGAGPQRLRTGHHRGPGPRRRRHRSSTTSRSTSRRSTTSSSPSPASRPNRRRSRRRRSPHPSWKERPYDRHRRP